VVGERSHSGGAVGLPGPVGVRANLGILRRMLADPVPVLEECAAAYGPTFALGVGPMRFVVVGDPAHLTEVFAQPNTSYRWGHYLNVLAFIVGPTSLIVSDGDAHQRRRSAVQPAFARRRIDGWVPMIVAAADRMIDERLRPAIEGDRSVDLYPIGKDLVLAITVQAFFGNGLEHRTAEIGAIFDELQAYLELPALQQFPHRIPGTRRARVRDARRAFDEIVDQEVARRRAGAATPVPAEDGPPRWDLLDVFLDEGSMLSTEEIHDQVNTLIGAGYNTAAATLAWAVQRALETPGIWDRMRAEADAVLGPVAGNPPGSAAVRDLAFTGAVVHEVLRVHPAGVVSPRQAVVDVPIGEHVIAKGSIVLWSPYLSGRDADAWPEPDRFRPERHLDPSADAAALMDAAWVPFGRGPRRCIGFALAQTELTLILARLAQRVDLALVDPVTPKPYGMVVNRPSGGVVVRAGTPVPG
jgi:cytochrome P450